MATADIIYPYADFPTHRFKRIGMTDSQIQALRAQWLGLSPADQNVQGLLIESQADNQVAFIAANFPAPVDALVVGVKGANPPGNPAVDDLWFDTVNHVWNQWSGTAWIPEAGGGGGTVDATARAAAAAAAATAAANTASISSVSTAVSANTSSISSVSTTVSSLSATVAGLSSSGSLVIRYTAGAYAARSTVTSSTTTPVEWRGPVVPAGMLAVDTWTNTGAVT